MAKVEIKLQDCLRCLTEEEVKNIYSKFFNFQLNTSDQIDAYTEYCLFEFKYDRSFSSIKNRAKTIAQALHYMHKLNEEDLVPDYICIANYKQACIFSSTEFEQIYMSDKIDGVDVWSYAPNSPCEELIKAVLKVDCTSTCYIYNYSNEADVLEFSDTLFKILKGKGNKVRQKITPRNIEKVWTIWSNHFGEYVKNDKEHKPTFYFYIDVQKDRTYVVEECGQNKKICFVFDEAHGDSKIVLIPTSEYANFWNRFKKLEDPKIIEAIQQKIYQLENTDVKKFQGMFYTPRRVAQRGIEYLEKVLGKEFWKNGQYRFWDMCAGTGNLEYDWPQDMLKYCYLSTIEADEVRYCNDLFPNARAIFQYNYLNDDVDHLIDKQITLFPEYSQIKKPQKLIDELNDPNIKWVVFINPPYAEASESKAAGAKRKDGVNDTNIGSIMSKNGYGKSAKELYVQFIYRILKEFPTERTYLGIYSTAKYMISPYNRDFRDKVFKPEFKGGFVINSKSFSQCRGKFPITFAIWDLSKNIPLIEQELKFDVIQNDSTILETTKTFVEPLKNINEWFDRIKNVNVMPPFSSAITEKVSNSTDIRDRVAENFIGFLASGGVDVQNNNYTCLMSTPTVTHMGTSITPDNYYKALIISTVRNLITSNWLNNRDQYSIPCVDLPEEFISDSIIWALFDNSNQSASIRDVLYKGNVYHLENNFFPYLKQDLSISSKFDDSFTAKIIASRQLSDEAKKLYYAGLEVYRYFFKNINLFDLTKWRIDKVDYRVGWYQIRNAIQSSELQDGCRLIEKVKVASKELADKLTPLVYKYGFLAK